MIILRTRVLSASVCLLIIGCYAFAASKDKEAAALIERAKQLSDIRGELAQAFVMQADFRILRDPGHPIAGSYTETWVSPTLLRTEVSAGDFHSAKVINERKRWEQSTVPETPKDISSAVSSIAYRIDHLSLKAAKIIDRTSGSWALRCIVGQDDGFGGREELCFDKSEGQLVAESSPFIAQGGGELVSRCAFTDFQKFGNKLFPKSIQCLEGEKLILNARVVRLTFDPVDKSIFAGIPGAKEFPNCPVQLKGPEPIESPFSSGVAGGPVVLSLIVGTDGRPHDLKVYTSAGADMDKAALEAVRGWRYKPATCEGQPMEVLIMVAVTSHVGNP